MKNHVIFSRSSLLSPGPTLTSVIPLALTSPLRLLLHLLLRLLPPLLFLLLILGPGKSQAQIISPHGAEVNFSYTASFEIPAGAKENTDEKRMKLHSSHLFGIFQSPNYIRTMGLDPEFSSGVGAPQAELAFSVLSSVKVDDIIKIKYAAAGRMILHKNVAAKLLNTGYFELPLPANPYAIYDIACTDSHYTLFSDFWYFYDPFRDGCKHLGQPPLSQIVRFHVTPVSRKKMDLTPKLPYLRGNNGNGDLFSIYVIHGYADSSSKNTSDDEGRVSFKDLNTYLLENGFTETREHQSRVIPMYVYQKEIHLDNGKKINVQLKHLLVETSINSRSKTFAKFFKDAVATADVIYYGGHSGLGGTLDIPSLEEKVGPFQFNPKKKQIFYFESCASYSYYLQHFGKQKTTAKIDIITNGLASYFYTSHAVLTTFLEHLLSTKSKDTPWAEILGDMESVLNGSTYLTSVGVL